MSIIRHRIAVADLKAGDTLITRPGAPTVTRVIPTKKGDKVQVYAGQGQPTILEVDANVWVTRAPISQAPTR